MKLTRYGAFRDKDMEPMTDGEYVKLEDVVAVLEDEAERMDSELGNLDIDGWGVAALLRRLGKIMSGEIK